MSVDGIIPLRGIEENPVATPVHFPSGNSNLPLAIGVPFLVHESGAITLPAIEPLIVSGHSLDEAALKIRAAYGPMQSNNIEAANRIIPVIIMGRGDVRDSVELAGSANKHPPAWKPASGNTIHESSGK